MEVREFNIKVVDHGVVFDTGKLLVSDFGHDVEITVQYKELNVKSKEEFPFVALQNIRKILEAQQVLLLINGNRIDVYPSGMQMNSFSAYEMEMGKPATESLDIFAPTDLIEKVGTVEQQDNYFDKWLGSLGLR